MTDALTRSWIRNASDERAAANGCRFDAARGAYAVWWIERFCRLYEGEQAGERLVLHGCHTCGTTLAEEEDWEEAKVGALRRAKRYAACVAKGHAADWQYEFVMRLLSWVKWSEQWGREVRRFRQASVWVAKKNKKSPTLAATGLYLLCGDGEAGQKVFQCAKDGQQARKNVGEHAAAMLAQSEELQAECRLNLSTYRITHVPSRSWMEPQSSSNERTRQSKEGLNGSVLVDETHVVDREFVARLSRAGISRSEPLHIEVSTAGNNPDGYGHERFVYAQEVAAGKRDDEKLLAMVYAAPADVSEEELAADPLKYARLANPALGHTVDPEELLDDFRTSRAKGMQEYLDCLMYRFNLWQRSSNPWLRAGDWAKCRRDFTLADLRGRPCWAGLDLSRTRDMTALVLVFAGDGPEEWYLYPFFWLPEERAHEIDHQLPVLTWARDGHLTLTPGARVDYSAVIAQFAELCAEHDIRELVYDPKFAEEPTQLMSEGLLGPDGQVAIAGTGVERVAFDQNDGNFAAPTEDFERFVLGGTLWHNGHPVLEKQVGHAVAYVRPFTRVKRVKKPGGGDWKTVDGVIAGIMGLARGTLAMAEGAASPIIVL